MPKKKPKPLRSDREILADHLDEAGARFAQHAFMRELRLHREALDRAQSRPRGPREFRIKREIEGRPSAEIEAIQQTIEKAGKRIAREVRRGSASGEHLRRCKFCGEPIRGREDKETCGQWSCQEKNREQKRKHLPSRRPPKA